MKLAVSEGIIMRGQEALGYAIDTEAVWREALRRVRSFVDPLGNPDVPDDMGEAVRDYMEGMTDAELQEIVKDHKWEILDELTD